MPSYYTKQDVVCSDRSKCEATWQFLFLPSDETRRLGTSRYGLLQYFLDLRLEEFLPNMNMHTAGVVTLMLSHVLGPQAFLLSESNAKHVGFMAKKGQLIRSYGIGREDLFYFGSSLFFALASVCGDFYDEKTDRSWKRFYSLLLRNLLISEDEKSSSSTSFRAAPSSTNSTPSPHDFFLPGQEAGGIHQFYTRRENFVLLEPPFY